jgi:two-component system chemotaxis response regulator CheY
MSEPALGTAAATPMNLLIVDDSTMMRMVIVRAVEATGLPIGEIFEAANGQQALEVLETKHVDALFTDISMPVMTGIELLRQIAGVERWQHMIRVVISTDGSDARRLEAGTLDVLFYVEKPFRPEVLRDVLSNITSAR